MDKAQGEIFRELPNTTLCDCGHPKTAHYQGEGCCEGCGCTWYHPNIGVIDMLKAGYRKLPEGEPPLLSDEGEKCISALERIILQFRSSQTSDIRRFSLGGYIGYLGQRLTEIYDLRIKRDSDIKWYGL